MAISGMRWGDEEDDLLPQRCESEPDSNGVRQIVEWKVNEAGDKVKVTKKVKKVTEVERISKRALERKKWAKFGDALDDGDGSNVTYMSYEEVKLEDPNADQVLPVRRRRRRTSLLALRTRPLWSAATVAWWAITGRSSVLTRTHPRRNWQDMAKRAESGEAAAPAAASASLPLVVPLWTAPLAPARAVPRLRSRPRVYLAKDRETFQSRGFAFVSFMYREDAEKALNKLQGYGYDHLILKLEWAKPSNKPTHDDAGSMGTTFRSGYGKALPQNVAPPPRK
ncbi:WD repeat-containing protein 36 [Phytophthora nicotianae]|uniref:WD repeat-containing protein 36 n=1 Tax=Phytophthora nicotianae TaxID=4792 RepID=A0A0W8CA84_PHYNI|nr:WD repeat-containing protein 36 [Phytophthora nicotianae]